MRDLFIFMGFPGLVIEGHFYGAVGRVGLSNGSWVIMGVNEG